MAADAHRLISLSLGKIANSRTQRGGISLHKNLLVAGVLHKARTVYMMENFHSMLQKQKEQTTEMNQTEKTVEMDCEPREHAESIDHEAPEDPAGNAASVVPTPATPTDAAPATTASLPCDMPMDNVRVETDTDNKENSPPVSSEVNSELSEDAVDSTNACKKCVAGSSAKKNFRKRRSSEMESSPQESSDSSPQKKLKEQNSCAISSQSDLSQTSCNVTDCSKAPSQCDKVQQTDSDLSKRCEAVQITHLVHSFSSGFAGLLSGPQSLLHSQISSQSTYCDSSECGDNSGVTLANTQLQGHSEGLVSCSTQIKEAFETLSRPIIAMTV